MKLGPFSVAEKPGAFEQCRGIFLGGSGLGSSSGASSGLAGWGTAKTVALWVGRG